MSDLTTTPETTDAPQNAPKPTRRPRTGKVSRAAKPAAGKATGAKTTRTRIAPTTPKAGPSKERVALAGRVSKARAKGTKWGAIALAESVSESALAALRKDVRAGKFPANVARF